MGFTRFLLAIWVVDEHGGSVWPGGLQHLLGRESVQLFYVMSGFYMTLVLKEKYSTTRQNITFYCNRILRLWPNFFVVSILTVLMFALLDRVVLFHLDLPLDDFLENIKHFDMMILYGLIITNLIIFGQDLLWFIQIDPSGVKIEPFRSSVFHNGSSYSLNHPIFTVAIELTFYLSAPFVLRKSLACVLFWLVAGAAYHAFLYLIDSYTIALSYHTFFSAIYFFALGACSYHLWRYLTDSPPETRRRLCPWLCVAAISGLGAAAFLQSLGIARMLAISPGFAVILPILFTATRTSALDRLFGELSYPVYVVHFPILTVLMPALLPFLPDMSYGRWLEGPIVMMAALLLLFAVDLPLDRMRQRLAHRATPSGKDHFNSVLAPRHSTPAEAAASATNAKSWRPALVDQRGAGMFPKTRCDPHATREQPPNSI